MIRVYVAKVKLSEVEIFLRRWGDDLLLCFCVQYLVGQLSCEAYALLWIGPRALTAKRAR